MVLDRLTRADTDDDDDNVQKVVDKHEKAVSARQKARRPLSYIFVSSGETT